MWALFFYFFEQIKKSAMRCTHITDLKNEKLKNITCDYYNTENLINPAKKRGISSFETG